MSLSSRELFHSNFLAWLFEINPAAIEIVLGIKSAYIPKREKYNIDFVITNDIHVYAIEVKVKDTPKKDQLIEYSQTLKDKLDTEYKCKTNEKNFLLSLMPPKFDLEQIGWEYISFKDLADRLTNWLKMPNCTHKTYIDDYIEMLKNLDEFSKIIIENDIENGDYWFFDVEKLNFDKLKELEKLEAFAKEIRFEDTFNKHRASVLLEAIEKEKLRHKRLVECVPCLTSRKTRRNRKTKKIDKNSDIGYFPSYGLPHKTPLACAEVMKTIDKDGNELCLGIQIEGKQYRRFVCWEPFKLKKDEREINLCNFIEKTDKYQWFSKSNGTEHHSFGNGYFKGELAKTRMRKNNSFCSYSPNFIYQYVNIGYGEDELIPDELPKAVCEDLLFAIELLEHDDYTQCFKKFKSK